MNLLTQEAIEREIAHGLKNCGIVLDRVEVEIVASEVMAYIHEISKEYVHRNGARHLRVPIASPTSEADG